MNALQWDMFSDRFADFRQQVTGNHHWLDLRNVAGLASILTADIISHGDVPAFAPELMAVVDALEDHAINSGAYDASVPLGSAPFRVTKASLHLHNLRRIASGMTTDHWLSCALQAAEVGFACVGRAINPERLIDTLLHATFAVGLAVSTLRRHAIPWIVRDRFSRSSQVLAFEAALDAGQRAFAYDLFDPL